MTCAEIEIDLPDEAWINGVSERHPDTRFRVLSIMSNGDEGFGTLEISSESLDEVLTSVKEEDGPESFEVLSRNGGTAVTRFETRNPLVKSAAEESKVPIETPFRIRRGTVSMRAIAPRRRISDFTDRLDERGLEYEVSYVRELLIEDSLTEKQREFVEKAVGMGYYDSPRGCSLTELADEMGVAKSTCSDTLHRAERNIVEEFLSDSG